MGHKQTIDPHAPSRIEGLSIEITDQQTAAPDLARLP